ncbi:MAG: collagen binding domain-containing protein [Rhodothermales bacterium]
MGRILGPKVGRLKGSFTSTPSERLLFGNYAPARRVNDPSFLPTHRMFIRLSLLTLMLGVVPARAQTTIAGRVNDLDTAGPLPGVHVMLCAPDHHPLDAPRQTWTDARGRFILTDVPPGRWCVQAVYRARKASYTVISPALPVGERPLLLRFEMPTALQDRLRHAMSPLDVNPKSLSTITGLLQDGYVTNADGAPLPGGRSYLESESKGILRGILRRNDHPADGALLWLPDTGQHTRTDVGGRFELTDIEPGTYRLYIVHRSDTLHIPPLEIKNGLNPVNLSFRKDVRK